MHLLSKDGYIRELNTSAKTMRYFAYTIQQNYNPVTYHNKTHAADVCQTFYYFMKNSDFIGTANLSKTEQACSIIAALVHDIDHPGYNNMYIINTHHELAVRYNDLAVLESYHAATAFKIMAEDQKCNILKQLPKKQFAIVRKLIITLVLSTDMSRHFGGKFSDFVS